MGTVGAEIKVSSIKNPELTNVFPVKPGVGQNIAMHVLPSTRNFFLALISTFLVHSPSFIFSKSSPYFLTILVLANAIYHLGLLNKIGHHAHNHKQFQQVPVVSAYEI